MSEMRINKDTPVEGLTPGGIIYDAGNARNFKTGDWRSMCPVWYEEKCTQCGLCFPVCPDDSIPVEKNTLKRKEHLYKHSITWKLASLNLLWLRGKLWV